MIALRAAHECAASNIMIFTAVTAAFGVCGILFAVAMMVQMRRDRIRHEDEMREHPLWVGSSTPGGWVKPAGFL